MVSTIDSAENALALSERWRRDRPVIEHGIHQLYERCRARGYDAAGAEIRQRTLEHIIRFNRFVERVDRQSRLLTRRTR